MRTSVFKNIMQVVFTSEIILTLDGILGILYGLALTLKTVGVLRPLGLQGRYWIRLHGSTS